VYYQHPDGERELLERWCLEYAPTNGTSGHNTGAFSAATAFASPDPIVQLRQVCKNIVIWLRTLYCWSRMLPAQALRKMTYPNSLPSGTSPPIGFSIYVVSEGQDDLSALVSEKGFSSQGQPHCVPTPYGELGWKVFYAPKDVVQRLMPEPSPPYSNFVNGTTGGARAVSKAKPIPTNPSHPQQEQFQSQQQMYYQTARSAPQHGGNRNLYRRANSDVAATHQYAYDAAAGISNDNNQTAVPRSYHHQRHHYLHEAHKAQSSGDMDAHRSQKRGYLPNHEETQPISVAGRMREIEQPLKDASGNNGGLSYKTKNLSGLSLALMMSDEQSLSLNSADDAALLNGDNVDKSDDKDGESEDKGLLSAAAEKRRAALHSAPPQFNASSPVGMSASPLVKAGTGTAMTVGEYGYAYNNHIPTMQQHPQGRGGITGSSSPGTPNTNNTSAALGLQGPQFPTGTSYTASPSLRPMTPLGSTPPGYLLSATPSTGMTGPITPSSVGSGGLIPPRSAVTPPFVRPMGFVGEAPNQQLSEATANAEGSAAGAAGITSNQNTAWQQHETSLDLLHSSPFQYPQSHSHYSMHAITSFGSSMQHHLSEHNTESTFGAPYMSEYYHRSGNFSEEMHGRGRSNSEAFLDHDLSDDMPFAVDPISSGSIAPSSATSGGVGSNPGAGAAAGLASMMNEASLMASMCTVAPKRLAMFDSKVNGSYGKNDTIKEDAGSSGENMASVIDTLADQLADFKSFGASLSVASATGSSFAPEAPTASAGSG
jgi:Autophagy-related protein 13